MLGRGDAVEFTEGGRRVRGWVESVCHKAREFVLTVASPDGKTFRHPRVGFDRCRVPTDTPSPSSPFGINQKVRVKATHPTMAGRVGVVSTLSPVDAKVDMGDGSTPWIAFGEMEDAEAKVDREFAPGRHVRLKKTGEIYTITRLGQYTDAWCLAKGILLNVVPGEHRQTPWFFEADLELVPVDAIISETPNSSPGPKFAVGDKVRFFRNSPTSFSWTFEIKSIDGEKAVVECNGWTTNGSLADMEPAPKPGLSLESPHAPAERLTLPDKMGLFEKALREHERSPLESPNRSPERFPVRQRVRLLWSPDGSDVTPGMTGRIRSHRPGDKRFRYEVEMDVGKGETRTLVYRAADEIEPVDESIDSSPVPPVVTPAQHEALLLAAAEMRERESRPKEPRCEAWKEEILLGAADWESEIPSRGVTFLTTNKGHLQVDATDTDEAVGTVTFTQPHCREAVVVMLNARLKAKRLDDAAGIVTPEEVVQP